MSTDFTEPPEPPRVREDVDRAQWLAGILAHSPDVISVLDLQGALLYVSRTLTDRDPASYIGQPSANFVSSPFRAAWVQALAEARETGEPQHVEVFSSGDYYWDTRIVPIKHAGKVTWLLTIGTDVTTQRGAEAALALKHQQLEMALAASGMGQWSWDIQQDRVTWDRATKKIFDWPEDRDDIDFAAYLERVHPADRERVHHAIHSSVELGQYQDQQYRIVLPDGSTRWIFCKGTVVKDHAGKASMLLGGVMDITHGKRTDEQLQRSATLEAIGQLAGGVAHDFNNLLVAILGNLDLAASAETEEHRRARIADATEAADRAAELTRQLLAFGRRQPLDRELVDCDGLLDGTLRLLDRLLPETIEIRLLRGEDLPQVLADRGQLEQVIVNLCLNARDAMPGGGTLSVETSLAVLDDGVLPSHPWARPGRYLLIRVTDNGVGIPADRLDRIFEPFFTTKPNGTGLGLATAYGVVKSHGGLLHVESEVSQGTVFNVYLPAGEAESVGERSTREHDVVGRDETVLLAEDETAVRAVVARMLERAGYRVISVEDGQQAVDIYLKQPDEFSLLLFDAVMPKKGGTEALTEIRERNPHIPAILSSGYTESLEHWQALPDGVKFIPKPYEPDQLLMAVRALLDRFA